MEARLAEHPQAFFRARIEVAKTVQREPLVSWERDKGGKFDAVQDLARDIRP